MLQASSMATSIIFWSKIPTFFNLCFKTKVDFFLKTGKRYRSNSFFIVIYGKFVLGWTFFSFRSWSMTSSPYPVHVNLNIFNFEKYSHVIPQTSSNSRLSLVFILFCNSSPLELCKSKFSNIETKWKYIAKTWWRHYDVTGHDRKLKKVQPNTNLP